MFLGMLRRHHRATIRAVAAAGLTAGGAAFSTSCCATGSGCFVSGSFCTHLDCFVPLFGSSVPIHAGSVHRIAGLEPLNPFRIIRVTIPSTNSPRDAASNLSASGWLYGLFPSEQARKDWQNARKKLRGQR